ncbi:transaldolase family protein [Candidatus Pelagibacter sp.]|jgi:transaldolase|nr:transaldolase family protein [Candidatus Pelagibacter sp.]
MFTKIYCDIADLKLIKKYNKINLVKGFTTNPTLMRKAGAKDYKKYAMQILKVCKYKPVSLEVFADDNFSMLNQAKKINSWGRNVYVKIPITNSKGKSTSSVISKLSAAGIKLNITAVYSARQTKQILRSINKNSKVLISIFAGRAGDTGKDPIPEIQRSIKLSKRFKNVKILWASVREPYNYLQANQLKCHLITVPPLLIDKIKNFGKTFNQLTTETVKAFLNDSKKSKFKI